MRYEDAEERNARPRRRKKKKSIPALILQDLLLVGGILLVFALFHHVIPRMTADRYVMPAPVSLASPAPTAAPTSAPQETGAVEETAPAQTPEPTPDPMDWRTKFAEHFTEEVVVTEDSYTSPNIAIHIEKCVTDDPSPSTYFVADIYVAQIENFKTEWAQGRLVYYGEESPLSLAKRTGAILSINGDYADGQLSGLLVRNGELYYDEQTTNDICVLYADGTMETYGAKEYKVEDVLARQPWQIWKFGPELLDEEGKPLTSFNTSREIQWENPRSGIGFYEPGHYCFIVVDGRQSGYSRGLELDRFAQIFADLGCKCAYNLDGGASAVMTFDQRLYSRPSNGGRNSGDILFIAEITEGEEG